MQLYDTSSGTSSQSDGTISTDRDHRYWLTGIELGILEHADWVKLSNKIVTRYRVEQEHPIGATGSDPSRFNILFSNTETWKSVLYSATPAPDIRRRYGNKDPIGRLVAETMERCVKYVIDTTDFDIEIDAAVQDMKLCGRGVVRLRYNADIIEREQPTGQIQVDEMTGAVSPMMEMVEEIADQHCWIEYQYWDDTIFPAVRRYSDKKWVAFRQFPDFKELAEQFGEEKASKIPLTKKHRRLEDKDVKDDQKRAEMFEVWDEDERKVHYVATGYAGIIQTDDDPLTLEGFFPMPRPLVDILTSDTIVPVPEFSQYEPLAIELDNVQERIRKLIGALRRRGVHNADLPELSQLADAGDNAQIPVANFSSLTENGGLERQLLWEDIKGVAEVLVGLYQHRQQVIQAIYEIVGISDVIRGAGDPKEKATMTRAKAQFGSLRVGKPQSRVQNFVRDSVRLIVECIAEHFEPHVILQMSGMEHELAENAQRMFPQMPPEMGVQVIMGEVMKVLRDDKLRGFRIDIETDSTVQPDADQDKKTFVELMQASAQMAGVIGQMPDPHSQKFFLKLFAEAFRKFNSGRMLEDELDEMIEGITGQAQQQQGGDGQAQAAAAQQKNQMDGQIAQADLQQKGQIAGAQLEQKGQLVQFSEAQKAKTAEQGAELGARADVLIAKMGNETELLKTEMTIEGDTEREKIRAEVALEGQAHANRGDS